MVYKAEQKVQQYDIPERADHYAIFDAIMQHEVNTQVRRWDCRKVVLLASSSLFNTTSFISSLMHAMGPNLAAYKIGCKPHTPYDDVIAVAHCIQEQNADCVISVGSGSYSDCAKIAVMAAATFQPHFTAAHLEAQIDQARGRGVLSPAKAKLILVPTGLSAGEWNATGSATNRSGKKQHFGRAEGHLVGGADLIVMDPELCAATPPKLWLSSGVRCIDHCIETICDLDVSEDAIRDALAGLAAMLKGLSEYAVAKQAGGKTMKEVYDSANEVLGPSKDWDLEWTDLHKGIADAQKGSRQAIKGLLVHRSTFGPSHAIGHQLGSVCGVPHGQTSCILLGPVLRYTKEQKKERQDRIVECFQKTLGWQEHDAADAFIRFVKSLDLPTTMSEVGVTDEAKIKEVALKTLTDIWGGGKPQLETTAQVMEILDMAR